MEVVRQIDSDGDGRPRATQPKQTAALSGLAIDITGLNEILDIVTTARDSVWELMRKVNRLEDLRVGRDQDIGLEISNLKDQLNRIELSLVPVLELVDEKRKTNAHLEKVLIEVSDALNQ